MILYICSFSPSGKALQKRIMEKNPEHVWIEKEGDTKEFFYKAFLYHIPIISIGAIGITVRMISPFVQNKLEDSAVISLDEKGEYVIPILSGHVGGANKIARELSQSLESKLVLTTASDLEEVFAIDSFAKRNGCTICNKEGIKEITSKLLRKETCSIWIHPNFSYDELPACFQVSSKEEADIVISIEEENYGILRLVFKPYVLGIGCKKDKRFEEIREIIEDSLKEEIHSIASMASIDLKRKEKGLLIVSHYFDWPFVTYSKEELNSLEGEFTSSSFVQQVTGVDCVCERAAVKCSQGTLIKKKGSKNGVTLALAKRKEVLYFGGKNDE